MSRIWFDEALLPDGWARHVRVRLDGGRIGSVEAGVPREPDDDRHVLGVPGLPNLHSHAFQHAMAGLAEAPAGGSQDDFWSWRELMYRLVDRLMPDDIEAIAAMAYVEMLETGFTRVGEFHYLHHQPSGDAYADRGEMAAAIASASATADIGLTLLPVYYAHANFGGVPPSGGQRRFINDMDGFARLLDASLHAVAGLEGAVVGIAPHSLRATTAGELAALMALAPTGPVHIHVAEQMREVEACLAWSGQRPVEWLLRHMPVDDRWCLVHATHVDDGELAGIVASGALVGLCPITEANLGDGLFPARSYLDRGGRFGIGSDSNIRIDAAEELRLLEYGRRLVDRRRNILAAAGRSTGRTLFEEALAGGAQALGVAPSILAPGAPADIISLSEDSVAEDGERSLDRWIFARGSRAIDTVWRAGRVVVQNGRHVRRDMVARHYRNVVRRLLDR